MTFGLGARAVHHGKRGEVLHVAAQHQPRPVKCATCKDVFVWSYSLHDHYEKRHPGIAVPPAMQNATKLRTHEEEWLKMVRNGKTPKACKVTGCPCGGKGL